MFLFDHLRTASNKEVNKPDFYFLGTLLLGIFLGTISKLLETIWVENLPSFLEALDLRNFLSRMGIWLFLGMVISIKSRNPIHAAWNVLFFYSGMITSYYLITYYVAGFFPTSYVLVWVVLTASSPILGFFCWYAKGIGPIAIVLSSMIVLLMTRQAFYFGFWYFGSKGSLEIVLWGITFLVVYVTPRQLTLVVLLSMIAYILTSSFSFFGGLL